MGLTLVQYLDSIAGRPWSVEEWVCWDAVKGILSHPDFAVQGLPDIDREIASSPLQIARAFAHHPDMANWRVVDPEHGAVAVMGRNDGGRGAQLHCGVYLVIGRPVIWHCDIGHDTVGEPLVRIAARGWSSITYYKRI